MIATANSLETLVKKGSKLERDIDQKLAAAAVQEYTQFGEEYAQQSSLLDGPPQHSPHSAEYLSSSMATEIEQLLEQLSQVVSAMQDDSMPRGTKDYQMQHYAGRLSTFTTDFRRIRKKITETKEHADLLLSVRNDISSYRNQTSSRSDALLRERGSIATSKGIADGAAAQGLEVKEALANQTQYLTRNAGSLASIRSTFQSMEGIMSAVTRKKSRDTVILAVVIGLCICFLLWYWLRS